jgi:putative endonuclease
MDRCQGSPFGGDGGSHGMLDVPSAAMPADVWFVYIAECADWTLYVGVARNVADRIAAHDAGRGARYTCGRGPLRLLTTRRCSTHGEALRLERALKSLPREQKLDLAASHRKLARFARSDYGHR